MVGREKEIELLSKIYSSDKPELLAVFGRRRVGKTFLIRSFFKGKIDFELSGLKNISKGQQLRNFSFSLKDAQKLDELPKPPMDWLDAFYQLKLFLESLQNEDRRRVVFLDEVPWLASGKSDFIAGFSYFWNSYASKSNVLVVICGSATAWMIQKIINDKGGLHNRVTQRIHLQPFTLAEVESFLLSRTISFDRYQILLLYMAIGGIPLYLEQVERGKSAAQNIDKIAKKFDTDYAFTMNSGLSLHKPISPFTLIHAYVRGRDLELFEDYLNLSKVDSASEASVCLIVPSDSSVFEDSYELHGLYVVSNVQLRSDLIDKGLDKLAREI
jgi:AAA+ ATPase superfamily predicted ATPase